MLFYFSMAYVLFYFSIAYAVRSRRHDVERGRGKERKGGVVGFRAAVVFV